MSQAEELLNGMSEEVPVHTHPVPDTDTYFVIDPITKQIENTNRRNTVIMQYTHNSERLTFELPRYIDGHDMLECTSVTVNADNIEVVESDGVEEAEPVEPRVNPDAPDITDLRIHPNDSEKAICSWLISRNSTQLAGILSFHIEFKCVDSNGNVVYEWSTDNYDEIEVRARKKNGEAAVVEHTDLLEQWRTRIFGAGDSVMANIAAEGEAQVAAVRAESETQQEAVELKGAQTLDSIPEGYTEVDAMADEAVRSKGDAIVCEVAGESIVVKDSSNDHIRGLKLFGKSGQRTTTGKNLFDEQPRFGAYDDSTGEFTEKSHMLCSANPIVVVGGTRYYNCNNNTYPLYFFFYDSAGTFLSPRYAVGSGEYITAPTGAATMHVNISSSYGKVYNNDICIATDKILYEPYTGGKPSPSPDYPQEIVSIENPNVRICGKNLVCGDATRVATMSNGITISVTEGSSEFILGGTQTGTANSSAFLVRTMMLYPGTYTFSVYGLVNPDYVNIKQLSGDQHYLFTSAANTVPKTFTIDQTVEIGVEIVTYMTSVYDNTAVKIQLEPGTRATEYESYRHTQALNIQHDISGIPVTSDGNYTDSDGQQWICDEIDLERGVYVQNTAIVNLYDFVNKFCVFSDNSNYSDTILRFDFGYAFRCRVVTPVLCNRFVYDYAHGNLGSLARVKEGISSHSASDIITVFIDKSRLDTPDKDGFKSYLQNNETIVCYALATPIETPLTAEEITAFKALRTNYPNTTILNDAGAWMSVKYNADTKIYVENPKVLKLVDSSTGVVYELKIVDGNLTVTPV